VWRRFVDPVHHTLYHYAGRQGEVMLPSPEECAQSQPNGMSWSTPIEDGPFFGGLYLSGQCRRWQVRQDEESAACARRIAAGLVKLAKASATPGFVPRGFGSDGLCHYSISSEDQIFPWCFGLWRYVRSGLPCQTEREEIVQLLVDTVTAIRRHEWRIPCEDLDMGYRGSYVRATMYDSSRLLFLHRALYDLTGDTQWCEGYRCRLDEVVGREGRTRLELCAHGMEYGPVDCADSCLWTRAMAQGALNGLAEMEADPAIREHYIRGLRASADRAVSHLGRGRRFDPTIGPDFTADWRFLNAHWEPQSGSEEAISLARRQLPLWAERNPRSPHEDDTVREPLFAAWIAVLAQDASLWSAQRETIAGLLSHYPWRELFTSTFFIAECLYYEAIAGGQAFAG
jgi:hypothetical protein